MDALFKALNDPVRRSILDALRQKDGQTLTEIEARFAMTRFGVMAHLRVLEEAGLVTTRKVGRWKYHYLNALPLQDLVDRWIDPLLQPATRAAMDLKAHLEGQADMTAKPDFIHQTFIRTTPKALWDALTTGAMSRQYYIAGAAVEGEAVTGGRMVWRTADGKPLLSGEVLRAEPFSVLDMTFEPHWGGGDRAASRAVYLIDGEGPLTRLTIEHYGIPKGQEGVREGWARIASALKTLLESGKPLVAA
jgi:DNA-binding transcriptional ArsR family regulator/uncharacterized protein YndB with AHSA1/START domain